MITFQGSAFLPALKVCPYCFVVCFAGKDGAYRVVKRVEDCACDAGCGHGLREAIAMNEVLRV